MRKSRVLLVLSMVSGLIGRGFAQEDRFWIVKEIVGKWEYREARDKKVVGLVGKYEILRPAGEVKCVALDNGQCKIRVLADRNGAITDMSLPKPLPNRWMPLKTVKAVPEGDPLIKRLKVPSEYQEKTRPGGSRDVTACGGSLPMQAPVCGETVDMDNFHIYWTMPESSGKTLSVILEKVDAGTAMIRRTAQAEKGEYSDTSLREFLLQVQEPNATVAVTVRVAGQEGIEGVRLIQVPSVTQARIMQARFRETKEADELVGTIERIMIAIEEGMWSRAGEESRRLMQLAPTESEFHKYALAGVCRSGFDNEKTLMRSLMTMEDYTGICGSTSSNMAQPLTASLTESPLPVSAGRISAVGGRRLGVALLIGNSSYLDVPLNSVDNDLTNLSEALEVIGFDVVVRKNLKEPKDFRDALEFAVKEKKAGPEDVLFVYYSGHGLEIEGKTHLLGTGLRASERYGEEIRVHSQNAEELLSLMERKDPGTRVLMIEACRNELIISERETEISKRGGFAFNRAGVPNTYIMFANRPGMPTPARSEYGLMGPFTESFIEALRSTSGEIREVFSEAKKNTLRISPGQDPILEMSDKADPIVMRPKTVASLSNRAAALLNSAETLYMSRDWKPYVATIERARVLAVDGTLRERLGNEIEFSRNVIAAEEEINAKRWAAAAAKWNAAATLFPSRRWVLMNAALALTLCNQLEETTLILKRLSNGKGAVQEEASRLLKELLTAMPELQNVTVSNKEEPAGWNSNEFDKVTVKE